MQKKCLGSVKHFFFQIPERDGEEKERKKESQAEIPQRDR